MSLFYQIAYRIGFAPWEQAATHRVAADQIARMFDREERERKLPYGRALDLGCGRGHWSIELARRGWDVTGVDIVPKAISQARERAARAVGRVTFIQGDLTALRAAGVDGSFDFFWDFGAIHGLDADQRSAVGQEVTSLANPDATILLLAWAPGRRAPLPRGASGNDIRAAFPAWQIADVTAFDTSGLPRPLRRVEPRIYRTP